MDELVNVSINARKQAFYNAYEINDSEIIKKIDDLFERINEFGLTHSSNFETEFLNSSLNQEYINLFTLVAKKCQPKVYEKTNNVKSDGEYLQEEVASELRYQTDELTRPIRRNIREKARIKAYDIPVLGDALTVKQQVDLFNKFKKNK